MLRSFAVRRGDGRTVLAVAPGWVRTDMGGAGADIEPELSVAGMRAVIERSGSRESGRFFDYTGKPLEETLAKRDDDLIRVLKATDFALKNPPKPA